MVVDSGLKKDTQHIDGSRRSVSYMQVLQSGLTQPCGGLSRAYMNRAQ
jgi:hypothetical protein